MVTSSDGSPFSVTNYQWDTTGCFTSFRHNVPTCFPTGQTTQNVTDNDLLAEDAGTITCTATIGGNEFTSELFTLRVSGIYIHILLILLLLLHLIVCTIAYGVVVLNSGDLKSWVFWVKGVNQTASKFFHNDMFFFASYFFLSIKPLHVLLF